jgi:hypothetical protein
MKPPIGVLVVIAVCVGCVCLAQPVYELQLRSMVGA